MFCIKDGEKQEDPSACEADGMPLSDEPCEAPCPALNETMEGSGNGTANATETEEPEEEGMYSFDKSYFKMYRILNDLIRDELSLIIRLIVLMKVSAKSITKTPGYLERKKRLKIQLRMKEEKQMNQEAGKVVAVKLVRKFT